MSTISPNFQFVSGICYADRDPAERPTNWTITRIWNQARFSFQRTILQEGEGCRQPSGFSSWLEASGNAGLWCVEVLPFKIGKLVKEFCKDPRVITIALTAFALLANSYAFYPAAIREIGKEIVDAALALLPLISVEKLKFAAWASSCALIASAGFGRALGRWSNEDLKTAYYNLGAK